MERRRKSEKEEIAIPSNFFQQEMHSNVNKDYESLELSSVEKDLPKAVLNRFPKQSEERTKDNMISMGSEEAGIGLVTLNENERYILPHDTDLETVNRFKNESDDFFKPGSEILQSHIVNDEMPETKYIKTELEDFVPISCDVNITTCDEKINVLGANQTTSPSELLSTKKSKPCLVVDGYQYRFHRKTKDAIWWLCIKDKIEKCNGRLKTNFEKEPVSKTEHTCFPHAVEIEIRRKMEICRKRVSEELSVPVSQIFHDEMKEIISKGYDFATRVPLYDNVKSTFYAIRRKALGTYTNTAHSTLSLSGGIDNQTIMEVSRGEIKEEMFIFESEMSENSCEFHEPDAIELINCNAITDACGANEDSIEANEKSASSELLSTSRGKPCFVVDGFQHRYFRKSKNFIEWACIKDKKEKCRGKVKTNLAKEIVSKIEHSCVSHVVDIEIHRKMEAIKKRVREELSIPVPKIFHEEMAELYNKGGEIASRAPTYTNAKTNLCMIRRKAMEIVQNPTSSELFSTQENKRKLDCQDSDEDQHQFHKRTKISTSSLCVSDEEDTILSVKSNLKIFSETEDSCLSFDENRESDSKNASKEIEIPVSKSEKPSDEKLKIKDEDEELKIKASVKGYTNITSSDDSRNICQKNTSSEPMSEKWDKPCLFIEGYLHQFLKRTEDGMSWVCINHDKNGCKGSAETSFENEILCKTEHSCFLKVIEINNFRENESGENNTIEDMIVTHSDSTSNKVSEINSKWNESETTLIADIEVKTECEESGDVNETTPKSFSTELLSTEKGKPCLVVDGFQHRIYRKTSDIIEWACIKDKKEKCRGKVRTNLEKEIISIRDHSCCSHAIEIEIHKKMEIIKKRVREEPSKSASKIFHEEMAELYNKGGEIATRAPVYSRVKTTLGRIRSSMKNQKVPSSHEKQKSTSEPK